MRYIILLFYWLIHMFYNSKEYLKYLYTEKRTNKETTKFS